MDAFLFQNLVEQGKAAEDGPQNHRRPAAYVASVWLGYPHEDFPLCHFSDYLILRGWDEEKLKRGLWRAAHADNATLSNDECAIAAIRVVQSWLTFGSLESIFEERISVDSYTRRVGNTSSVYMDYMWKTIGIQLLPLFYGQSEYSEVPELRMFHTKNLVSNLVSLSARYYRANGAMTDPKGYAQRLGDAFVGFAGALQSFNSIDIYKMDSVSGPMFRGPDAKIRAFLHQIVMREEGPSSMVNCQTPDTKIGSIFPWILIFPALLGETVQLHLSSLIPDVEITEPRLIMGLLGKALVLESKWCPYTLERLRVATQYTVLYWLWASAFTEMSEKSHSECNELACSAYRISDESLYAAHHVDKCDGSCVTFYADINKITRVYDSGGFPIITVTRNSDPSMTRPYVFDVASIDRSSRQTTQYTAFSHVWADGFGSTTEQGMPICQVNFLANSAVSVNGANPQTTSFWIDSLCIPGNKRLRKNAIVLMTNVYKSAASVVVLDRTLQKCSSKVNADELLLRIYTSPWMTRVWTYQEGVLAAKLYFKLSDAYCSLDFSQKGLNNIYQTRDVYINFRTQLKNLERAVEPMNIGRIINELRWRDTLHRDSKGKNDEIIAVAVLLDLDMSYLLEVEGHERMVRFLLLVKILPRDIIFSYVERLEIDGFRWAPSTFLVQDDRRLSTDLENRGVMCTPNGLLGTYLVFQINSSQPISGISKERRSIIDRHSRRWFEIDIMNNNVIAFDFDHIIISPEALPDSTHGTIFVAGAVLTESLTEHSRHTQAVKDQSVDLVCKFQQVICLFNLREFAAEINYEQDSWPGLIEGRFKNTKILLR